MKVSRLILLGSIFLSNLSFAGELNKKREALDLTNSDRLVGVIVSKCLKVEIKDGDVATEEKFLIGNRLHPASDSPVKGEVHVDSNEYGSLSIETIVTKNSPKTNIPGFRLYARYLSHDHTEKENISLFIPLDGLVVAKAGSCEKPEDVGNIVLEVVMRPNSKN